VPNARPRSSDLGRRIIGRLAHLIRLFEDAALAVLIGAITSMAFAGVIARYVFSQPLQWSDEIALGLFVWLTFLGAAVGWRSHDLFGIDMLVDRFPRRLRQAVWFFNYSVIALVCIGGIWWGTELANNNWLEFTLNLQIPRFYIDIAFPVGMALLLWHTAEHMARLLHGELPVDDRYAVVSDETLAASGPTL
jgi:TRAP-type C4-dicarboxylate transport system permease small subunit